MYHQMQGKSFKKNTHNETNHNFQAHQSHATPADLKVYFIVLAISFFKSTCPLCSETAKSIVDS